MTDAITHFREDRSGDHQLDRAPYHLFSFPRSFLANAETRIIYRQESDQLGITAQTLSLTGTEQSLLPGLGIGQGLWKIKDRSFVVQHQLHPDDLTLFHTLSRML